MSIKDWKNKELTTLLSEAWGFKFNSLQEFEEFDGAGEVQTENEEEVNEEAIEESEETVEESEDSLEEGDEEVVEESPSHPAADREGNRSTGRRVKQGDGQRLAEEGDELKEDEELEEGEKPDFLDLDNDGDKDESMKDAAADADDKDSLKEAIVALLRKHLRD